MHADDILYLMGSVTVGVIFFDQLWATGEEIGRVIGEAIVDWILGER